MWGGKGLNFIWICSAQSKQWSKNKMKHKLCLYKIGLQTQLRIKEEREKLYFTEQASKISLLLFRSFPVIFVSKYFRAKYIYLISRLVFLFLQLFEGKFCHPLCAFECFVHRKKSWVVYEQGSRNTANLRYEIVFALI